ncbi:DUF3662 and FHA domain-containing protein [Antrihabitans cavernicola]|uniref:DUF2662 domain-containing protein n=1 Tax=Antrihabitans cavernicola TaxID=2495913 RepID=A0A5A7SHT2_9NOCA|nr:DUF3662 and FHA domain-containing protein [Spelaeibacter cavernicola]KAA0024919.1 DUF2662 domain-containing protein [Spelaeibacter cavernicola]
MGIVQRFERKLQGAVGDAFARVFGGSVVPQEVETALQHQAADHVQELEGGHLLASNSYVITINSSDYDKLASDHDLTVKAFARHLEDYIREQGWQTYGDIHVEFEASPTLHTGQFRTRGRVDPDAGLAQQRPLAAPSAPNRNQPGAGPMTQNSGYDPSREPADNSEEDQRRSPAEDPRYARGGYQQQPYQNGAYQDRGYQNGQQRYSDYPQGQEARPSAFGAGYDRPPAQDRYAPPPQQPYQGGGYQDQPYQDQGYQDQGYDQPYQEQGYQEPHHDQGYQDRGYAPQQPGYADQGYQDQGYQDQHYQDQGYAPPAQYGAGNQPNYNEPAYSGGNYAPQGGATYSATLQLDDGSGRTYQLREGANIIGRGQEAHFRLPDTGVSRRHIEVRWDGQMAMLSDLGSTNGTSVNGAPVQDWQLADGDMIRAGHSEILIRIV